MVVDPHFSLLGVWIGGLWVESRGEYAGAGALARFRELDCADCAGKRKSICLLDLSESDPLFSGLVCLSRHDTRVCDGFSVSDAIRPEPADVKHDKRSHGSRYNLLPLVQPPMSYWCSPHMPPSSIAAAADRGLITARSTRAVDGRPPAAVPGLPR